MENKIFEIALTLIPNVGPVTARNLISYCGSAQAVFESSKKELLSIPGIGVQMCHYIKNKEVLLQAEQEINFIEEQEIEALFFTDADFPSRLNRFPDSPALLYYKGNARLNPPRTVAIVGTRKPSPRGVRICEELVEGLLPYGVTVVSGLAYGIDIVAHRKSLDLQIPNIGVLGHGLREIYPPQHRNYAKAMIECGGLLTEYASATRPDREHFPMRNRIVAGICDALIVVETQGKGGSMITASLANGYNKDVFTVPGRVQDKCSEGCNLLIKSHKANLLESIADLVYIMRWDALDEKKDIQKQLFIDLTADEKKIVDLLGEQEELGIDMLSSHTQLSSSQMAGLLLELEFKGIIKSRPGCRYILV